MVPLPTGAGLAEAAARMGDMRVAVPVLAVFALQFARHDRRRALAGVFGSLLVLVAAMVAAKLVFYVVPGRSVGIVDSVSGHAAIGMFVLVVLASAYWNWPDATIGRYVFRTMLVLLGIGLCAGRLLNGAHTPVEIACGLALGVLAALLCRAVTAGRDRRPHPLFVAAVAVALVVTLEVMRQPDMNTEDLIRAAAAHMRPFR